MQLLFWAHYWEETETDYISWLVWENLGLLPEELEEGEGGLVRLLSPTQTQIWMQGIQLFLYPVLLTLT